MTETFDPIALLELQAAFGQLLNQGDPRLVGLVNATAPALFATLLFTVCQEFKESDDGESVEPTVDPDAALARAVELITAVRNAMASFGAGDHPDVAIEATSPDNT
jgi:hypothetical protein